MLDLYGDYMCKADNKGRVLFPAKLRKKLDEVVHEGFMVNRDIYRQCLVLYPMPEWKNVQLDFIGLNRYNEDDQDFMRMFLYGATDLFLDAAGRMMLPSVMTEHAGLDFKKNAEMMICGMGQKMEIWNPEIRKAYFAERGSKFGEIAGKTVGAKKKNE